MLGYERHEPITSLGCWLDNHRGHYITRDAIWLAQELGFIVGQCESFALDMYESHGHEDNYPHEMLRELCDEAVAWLNCGENTGVDRAIQGQNSPPAIPEDCAWSFFDGDFGLYAISDLEG
jgi:hypothetical protein